MKPLEHLPAIEAAEELSLVAVYSRSQSTAESLASEAKSKPATYYDNPDTAGKSLDDLLARTDISAVIVCLPILNQPDVIMKSLAAGKHVLSEKPIGKDLATGASLLEYHAALPSPPIWAVAENFRFQASLQYAASKVKEVGGRVVTFHLRMNGFVRETDKYFNTPCELPPTDLIRRLSLYYPIEMLADTITGRKIPEYQGGFLLDGGVHFVAGLRLLLGAAGDEVQKIACFSTLLEEKLLPVDTVHAIAVTRGGSNGTICISFGTEFKSGLEVEIVTTTGAVTWNPTEVKVVRKDRGGDKTEEKETFARESGVKPEVVAFAKSIGTGSVNPLQAPGEALLDLEILQTLLESGESGASIKTLSHSR